MNPLPQDAQQPKHAQAEALAPGALSPDLVSLARSLHQKYDERLGPDLVEDEIELVAEQFNDAAIRTFVPLFIRRGAEAALSSDCESAEQKGAGTP